MKIILSPSKLQRPRTVSHWPMAKIVAPDVTAHISRVLTYIEDSQHHGLSDSTGKRLGYSVTEGQLGHALATYTGIVFQGLDWVNYEAPHWDYAQRHLRILSAFYGVLTPLTGIKPYRLDMTAKIPEIKLYRIWQEIVNREFNHEDIIVDLASKEYSQMLDCKGFTGRLLTIDFKEEQMDGRLKIVTVYAKQARGLMAQYMIQGLIEDVESLKHFSEQGYQFSEAVSSSDHYVFVRPYGWGQAWCEN